MSAGRIEEIERLLMNPPPGTDINRLQTELTNLRERAAMPTTPAPAVVKPAPVRPPSLAVDPAMVKSPDAGSESALRSLSAAPVAAAAPPPTPAPAPTPAQPTEAEQAQGTIREVGRLESLAGMVEGAGNIGRALAGVAPGSKTGEAFREQGKRLVAEHATLELDPTSEISQREARLIEDAMPYMKGRLVGKYSAKQLRGNDIFMKVLAASGKAAPAYDIEGVRQGLLAHSTLTNATPAQRKTLEALINNAKSEDAIKAIQHSLDQTQIAKNAGERLDMSERILSLRTAVEAMNKTGKGEEAVGGIPARYARVISSDQAKGLSATLQGDLHQMARDAAQNESLTKQLISTVVKAGGWEVMPTLEKAKLQMLYNRLFLDAKNKAGLGAALTANEQALLASTLPDDPTKASAMFFAQVRDPVKVLQTYLDISKGEENEYLASSFGHSLASPRAEVAAARSPEEVRSQLTGAAPLTGSTRQVPVGVTFQHTKSGARRTFTDPAAVAAMRRNPDFAEVR